MLIVFQIILRMVATFFTAFYINLEKSTTKSGAKTLQNIKKMTERPNLHNNWILPVATCQ